MKAFRRRRLRIICRLMTQYPFLLQYHFSRFCSNAVYRTFTKGSPFEEDDVDEEKAAEAITINDESIGNVLPESRVEDVAPLVGAMETESEPTEQAVNFKTESSNIKSTDRIKNKPLKTLWKKATKKFSSSSAAISSAPTITGGGVGGAGAEETSATSSTVGSEATAEAKDSTEHKTVIRSSSQQQQRDDEIQLTLAEETDDE